MSEFRNSRKGTCPFYRIQFTETEAETKTETDTDTETKADTETDTLCDARGAGEGRASSTRYILETSEIIDYLNQKAGKKHIRMKKD